MTYKAPADTETTFKLEWFNGNKAALDMALCLARLSNLVDDLVDKDVNVTTENICEAFLSCLVELPSNPFYAAMQKEIAPMWLPVFSAFETATEFEKKADKEGLERGHMLRYMPGMIISHAIIRCVGYQKAREYVPLMWKVVANERLDDYLREHLGEYNDQTE